MGSYAEDWGTLAWTVDPTISGVALAAGAGVESNPISNSGKLTTEVSVEIQYDTYASDMIVYLLRDVDGTNYEDTANAFGFTVPGAASVTRRRTISVPSSIGRFKVRVSAPSGTSATLVTVRVRQSAGVTA